MRVSVQSQDMETMQSPPQSPEEIENDQGIAYDEEFSNSLMRAVLEPPSPSGITVLDRYSRALPVPGESVRHDEVDPIEIDPADLPLALDDPRRVYKGFIPGVRLSQPGGLLEGGSIKTSEPGEGKAVPPEIERFARQEIAENGMRVRSHLKNYVNVEQGRQQKELGKRMAERQAAIEHNAKIDKEIEQLEAQRAMERRLEERMMNMAKDRRDSG